MAPHLAVILVNLEPDIAAHADRKIVLRDSKVADELGLSDPVGKEIYVGSLPVAIIGVMEKRGQALGQNMDDLVFIPFDTAVNLLGHTAGEQIQLRLQAVDCIARSSLDSGYVGA